MESITLNFLRTALHIAHDLIHMNVSTSTCSLRASRLVYEHRACQIVPAINAKSKPVESKEDRACDAGDCIRRRARCSASSPALVSMLALSH